MTGTAVRRIYERRPYPDPRSGVVAIRRWRLPPIPWINAMSQPPRAPHRILVAGCGSGSEAFALQRKFPEAKVVGIDFSPRSIRAAKEQQKRSRELRKIRFLVSDLTKPGLAKTVGKFDFVSCHGVISYIERPEQALRNLANCLQIDGALYLGVNGQSHFSSRWRRGLPKFGIDVTEFQDTRSIRQLLKVFDALCGYRIGTMAKADAGYLASDLFGPLLHNWSLADWMRACRKTRLHLLASYSSFFALRPIFDPDLNRLLIPRSRAEVLELLETLRPSTFHRLLLSHRPEVCPPWQNAGELLRWRAIATGLYVRRWPKRTKRWKTLRRLTLTSAPTNTVVELQVPEWEVELLRRANGRHSIADVLSSVSARISPTSLRDALYLLYLLGAINLRTPTENA
jgi:SAM-dependent methyltransferase